MNLRFTYSSSEDQDWAKAARSAEELGLVTIKVISEKGKGRVEGGEKIHKHSRVLGPEGEELDPEECKEVLRAFLPPIETFVERKRTAWSEGFINHDDAWIAGKMKALAPRKLITL